MSGPYIGADHFMAGWMRAVLLKPINDGMLDGANHQANCSKV